MKILLLLLLLFQIFVSPGFAADKEVVCNNSGCSSTTTGPIFPSTEIWYPGKSLTKSIRVVNNGDEAVSVTSFTANFFNVKELDKVISMKIVRLVDGVTLFENFLTDYYASGTLNLSTIGAGSSDEYFYTATMDPEAGNGYQEASSKFDLHLNFIAGTANNDRGIGGNVSGASTDASPPVCNATTPTPLQNILVSGSSANTVTLIWNSVSPVTHYALIFTRLSDGEKYGSTNIGKVNTYTVTNLSGGENYEFEVFGVNDCAPGKAGKVTRTITGVVVEGRPVGEDGLVLGVNTLPEPTQTETVTTTPLPGILGSADSSCQDPWWKTIFKIVLSVFPFIMIFRWKKLKHQALFTLSIITLAFIVDRNYFCTHNLWPLYILISYLLGKILINKKYY